ncbi:MAG: hypothetical protein PHN69_06975 [Candidatus Pacebacteria bacterium]|nr:hypothetical protein [Candidatus Paceibacterota bacterium]
MTNNNEDGFVHITLNTDKKLVRKVKKQMRQNYNCCPYFLNEKGIGVHCFCHDILEAAIGEKCHTGLWIKK